MAGPGLDAGSRVITYENITVTRVAQEHVVRMQGLKQRRTCVLHVIERDIGIPLSGKSLGPGASVLADPASYEVTRIRGPRCRLTLPMKDDRNGWTIVDSVRHDRRAVTGIRLEPEGLERIVRLLDGKRNGFPALIDLLAGQ